jgi:hypothetical protein
VARIRILPATAKSGLLLSDVPLGLAAWTRLANGDPLDDPNAFRVTGSGAGYLRTPFGVRFFEMERPLVARPKAAPSASERFDAA